MITYRSGVFETNSSSTHSLIISTNDKILKFINGEAFLNVLTEEILLLEEIPESEKLMAEAISYYLFDSNQNRSMTCIEKNLADNYEISDVSEYIITIFGQGYEPEKYNKSEIKRLQKMTTEDEFKTIKQSTESFRLFKDLCKNNKKYADIVGKFSAPRCFITFSEVDEENELAVRSYDVYKDENGTKYTAIGMAGSDSFHLGRWPTR